jgi:hypothetical protein
MLTMNKAMNNVTYKNDFQELRTKASNAVSYVLMCSNYSCTQNFTNSTTSWRVDEEKKWQVHLQCSVCDNTWSICCQCNNFKIRLATPRQLHNHYNTYHHTVRLGRKRKKVDDDENAVTTKTSDEKQNDDGTSCSLVNENNYCHSQDNDCDQKLSAKKIPRVQNNSEENTIVDNNEQRIVSLPKVNDKEITAYKILMDMQSGGMAKQADPTIVLSQFNAYQKLYNLVNEILL